MDVVMKCISGNTLKNGSAVFVDKLGNKQTRDPDINKTPSLTDTENKYTARFDSGDTI